MSFADRQSRHLQGNFQALAARRCGKRAGLRDIPHHAAGNARRAHELLPFRGRALAKRGGQQGLQRRRIGAPQDQAWRSEDQSTIPRAPAAAPMIQIGLAARLPMR